MHSEVVKENDRMQWNKEIATAITIALRGESRASSSVLISRTSANAIRTQRHLYQKEK